MGWLIENRSFCSAYRDTNGVWWRWLNQTVSTWDADFRVGRPYYLELGVVDIVLETDRDHGDWYNGSTCQIVEVVDVGSGAKLSRYAEGFDTCSQSKGIDDKIGQERHRCDWYSGGSDLCLRKEWSVFAEEFLRLTKEVEMTSYLYLLSSQVALQYH